MAIPSSAGIDAAVTTLPTELSPVAPGERIAALDLLRGWAMFGVLLSNLNDWYGTKDPSTSFDHALQWLQGYVIESRFYTLLCFLFGIGFGLQLMRATARGEEVTRVYYRRVLALLLIGLVHGWLIWSGDILVMYALVAFALVMFRNASPRRILAWSAVCWFLAPEVVWRARWFAGLRYMLPGVDGPTTSWVLGHGSWLDIAPIRLAYVGQWFGRWSLGTYFSILAMFLLGLWAVKSGYLRRVIDDPRTTRRLLMIALLAAAAGYLADIYGRTIWPFPKPPAGFWSPRALVFRLLDWATVGTALASAAILLLLAQRPRVARWLRPLAATGRMALTTYLTQSVVCTVLFYGYGFGWYGQVGHTGMLLVTLVLFSIQMAVSSWWLQRYRFGPAEWLWRTMTYGKAPKMREV